MTPEDFLKEWHNESELLLVHTSGSTGVPKPMWVEKQKMRNSARITCDFLGLQQDDTALLCMPLDYIAGKMMMVRAIECGLRLTCIPPSGHPLAFSTLDKCVVYDFSRHQSTTVSCSSLFTLHSSPISLAAMVPMQVYNSLQSYAERQRLMSVRHLIIGGGAIDEDMERELRDFPNVVWSTYGMTETLSHIALRRLNGKDASQYYTPFDSVDVSLNGNGCLVINAPLVCDKPLTTNDIAEIAPDGRHFKILGRKDNVICSGGIKIQAEEVERILKPYIRVPYIISKRKDSKFGEIVVLVVQSADAEEVPVDMETIKTVCRRVLPKFWQPREYISTDSIPMTGTGKLKRNFL